MLNKLIIATVTFFVTTAALAQEVIKLNTKNTVLIRGEISGESVTKATMELVEALGTRAGKDYPIYIVLDSPGGDIEAGEDFIQFAKVFKNIKTVSVFAASMASSIVEALPGERLITDTGTLMFHRAKGGFKGQFETGELESELEFAKEVVRRMERRSASRIGMTLAEYKARVKDEMWLTAEHALQIRAADRVVALECSKDLIDGREVKEIAFFIFRIKLEFSTCPLLRSPSLAGGQDEKLVQLYERATRSNAL